MGEMQVPEDAYYGAQTARAVENFPVSGQRMPRRFIAAMGQIKKAAAEVNLELGFLSADQAKWIIQAADEVIAGKLEDQFPVDVYQTGSGTSTNMNVNEVIAGRANEMATGKRGGKSPVHPNDHVNLQQSSNDVIPTAMHLSAIAALGELADALLALHHSLRGKAAENEEVIKIGRTHLQDATPISMGQVMRGWADQAHFAHHDCLVAQGVLSCLPLGGTAVGTGINSHPAFAGRVIERLTQTDAKPRMGKLRETHNHVLWQSTKDQIVRASGQLRAAAVSLSVLANNIRHLSSGPRCGIGELVLPATQPGSSIMPGKVNPVMCEMLMMACARVMGADATIVNCAQMGSTFELNVMMPLMAAELLHAIELLASAVRVFDEKCVKGLEVDRAKCEGYVEQSLAMCTALAPIIGYDAAADIAKAAHKTGKTVREIATERKVLPAAELEKALDPRRMTEPQADMVGSGGG